VENEVLEGLTSADQVNGLHTSEPAATGR
jgi:hypothetical protein